MPSTKLYGSQVISRQIRSRCRWSLTTLIFAVDSTSTSPQMKSTPATTRGTPLASHLSEKGTDPIDEQPKCHSPWKVYPSWQYDLLVQNDGIQKVKLIYMVRHAEGTHNVNRDYKSIEHLDARLTPLGENQCHELCDELLLLKKELGEVKNAAGSHRHRQGLEHLMKESEKPRSGDEGDGNDNSDICVVVSPLTRCIQTALLSFDFLTPAASLSKRNDSSNSGNKVPVLALEALRETVNYNCDRRRRISDVADEFPQIDFSFCQNDEDEIWMSYQKREKDQAKRIASNNKGDLVDTTTPTQKNYLESAQLYVVADRGRQALEFIESLPQSKIAVCTHSAYLRCILNWGQTGGVPRTFDQTLDDREDPTRQDKLFDYCYKDNDCSSKQKSELDRASFEEYMREDYKNAEIRSFCLLVQ
jgi:broad specificity phosphatase PhoE